jgi:hypothetical protein
MQKSLRICHAMEPSGMLQHKEKYSTGKGSNRVEIISFD